MINKKLVILILIIIFYKIQILASETLHKIEILVNDTIITNYDIAQHFALNSVLNDITITQENGEILYQKTIDDLIDMKLQQLKIKEYKIEMNEEESEYYESYFFKSKNLNKDKVLEFISKNNLDRSILYEKINTAIAWEKLSSGLFYRTVSVSEIEIEELLKNDVTLSPEIAKRILVNKQVRLKSDKYLRDLRAEANIEKR